jgi:hypothetical protein
MPQIFEQKMLRLSDISGVECAWAGCVATYSDHPPKGWVMLLAYWSPKPFGFNTTLGKILRYCQRDAALCPEHARALEAQLKDIGRRLGAPAAGQA